MATSSGAGGVERWKAVPGYAGHYDVSDIGRVRSLATGNQHGRRPRRTPLILKPRPDAAGRLHICLCDGRGGKREYLVSRLVLMAWAGACPDGHEACHGPDPDPANNALTNLRWDTREGIVVAMVEAGRQARGARIGTAKLSEDAVRRILARLMGGAGRASLAREFGVHPSAISLIATGRNWKSIPRPVDTAGREADATPATPGGQQPCPN